MKIEEYEIKKWAEGFNDIRKVLQTSAFDDIQFADGTPFGIKED